MVSGVVSARAPLEAPSNASEFSFYSGHGIASDSGPLSSGCSRGVWMTPNTFDGASPKSQEGLDHEATKRPGRSNPNNLRDQVQVELGQRVWPTAVRQHAIPGNRSPYPGAPFRPSLATLVQQWPTMTRADRHQGDSREGRDGGPSLRALIAETENWPTARSTTNRNSREAITRETSGDGRRSDLGLAQAVEVVAGMLPRELSTAQELPPRWRAQWATPRSSENEQRQNKPTPSQLAGKHGLSLGAMVQVWPTAMRADGERTSEVYAAGNATLLGAVRTWPTATRSAQGMSRNATSTRPEDSTHHPGRTLLDEVILNGGEPFPITDAREVLGDLVLNPDWVERLMGLPVGWTDVPMTPELLSEIKAYRATLRLEASDDGSCDTDS